jgi:uncharacterized protein YegP (UPF0339 family)
MAFKLYSCLAVLLLVSTAARAELQTTLSISTPVLTPGQNGSFTATTVNGPAGSTTSTLVNSYAGVHQYQLSPGTGRFASISGTRYGIFFDAFQIFQSFLTSNFFTVVNSNTTCPAATNYTWLLFRWRSPDAPRNAMDARSTQIRVGGTIAYNPVSNPTFNSSYSFDLAGPTTSGTSYSLDSSAYGGCSSAVMKVAGSGSAALDAYGRVFFGTNNAMYIGGGGNPVMATLVPQQTLTSGTMTALANHVLSGLFTGFTSMTSQTQNKVYVYPDAAGTTFTLKTINNYADPTNFTTYGTLACTSLNTPTNGFCSGTLSIVGTPGTTNAICQIGSTSSQDLLSCTFAMPNQLSAGGSLVATRSTTSLLSTTISPVSVSTALNGSTTITATLQNMTGTRVTGMANPSAPGTFLVAPFSNPGAYTGAGGTCSATLNGFSTCTVSITYNPTAYGTTIQVFRTSYNNQAATVNATGTVIGGGGISSIAVTPNSSYFALGASQQFGAIATYGDGSTQTITNAVTWASSAPSIASMNSTGLASFLTAGSSTLSATLGSAVGSITPTVYVPPPNPSGLSATPNSYTQITLNWTSGGGTTNAFQIAYQAGATAPADCNSGTVISSGVVGNVTNYAVTGLFPATQYAFRVCAVNSIASAISSGVTTTGTTLSPHKIFSTTNVYQGNLGGLYFADYICQTEALNAGLTGTWKAALSDGSTAASSRISLSQSIYNMRPNGSGGPQVVATSAAFWSGTWSNNASYAANGGAAGSTNTYTGSTFAGGVNAGRNCTNWTTNSAGVNGEFGTNTSTNTAAMANNVINCSNSASLYCINLQSSSAAPPNPTSLATITTASTSIQFSWASGGGTTAAYQMSYQAGASAPANCTTGTVISASSIGINPNNYTVTGLTANTQYSFRLCAANSDLTAFSSGTTLTVTTTASGTITNLGTRQIVFGTTNTYTGGFGGIYFGDYICQSEATTAGLNGIWRAILSDNSTTALSRISIPGVVYNNRPSASGGYQQVAADAAGFWSSSTAFQIYYNASGTNPGSTVNWTGSTTAGAISAGNTCTGWTSSSVSIRGQYGSSNTTGNTYSNGNNPCNNFYSLYCTNQQSASAAPPDPTSFSWTMKTSSSIQLSWASGGGTTAAYRLAYQSGASAPIDCNSGTVVAASVLGVGPTSYSVTGLSSGAQYSFRLCAQNSDLSSTSTGITQTITTSSSGTITNLGSRQVLFSTAGTYSGSFGGLYFGDFLCQRDADAAGLSGTWKAVLSDDTTSALSRISIPGAVYNNRPFASGGYQQIANDSPSFWSSVIPYTTNYNASGGTPGSTVDWTGTNTNGSIVSGFTCSSWTTASSGVRGQYGVNNTTGNIISNGNTPCNGFFSLACINQQSSAAAPPDPVSFNWVTKGSASVQFTWTSGGGTTAAYQMAYQTGGTAPANCTSGTVISTTTLGNNPTGYTVTGLSANTQYSFRLCASNSDNTSLSTGVTQTVTTTSSGTVTNLGSQQIVFSTSGTYQGSFGGIYYADYVCQTEAANAGLTGVWKSILSDESVSALSRISIAGAVYNNRPSASGGYQLIATDSSSFWSSAFPYNMYYNASGSAPGAAQSWTGSTSTGASFTGFTCSSWTTASASSRGEYGSSNTTGNIIATGQPTCNNYYSFLCTNQQAAPSAPPDPLTFSWSTASTTTIQLTWTSGGGTTAAYKLAYQTGASAPASCSAGTVIGPTTLGLNPTGYALSSLTSGTQYSFRLCALNSDQSSTSTGITLTVSTSSSGTLTNLGTQQVVFSTDAVYSGAFGGLYFGDFACQQEAETAGYTGVWKAILSDEVTSAISRITIPGAVYNTRPAASGGFQQVAANSASFWSGSLSVTMNYNALGTVPGGTNPWTGTSSTGTIVSGNTCTSWTTNSSVTRGYWGQNNTTGNELGVGNPTCSNRLPLYCTNQQTASATPNNPATFNTYSVGADSVGFTWTSGGGTTAGYRIAYQTGASAPANCNSGTIISASTLGVNPTTYVVTGLSNATQYSFRLCAVNSDQSALSTGITSTVTTSATGAQPTATLNSTQVIFQTTTTYAANFGGLYFGDYICQQEATNAGLPGVWKAILSDDSTAASTRISVSGNIFNNRPVSAGGIQLLASGSTNFWSAIYPYSLRYSPSGGTPTNIYTWGGSTSAGAIKTGLTCTGWTTNSGGSSAEYAVSSNTYTTGAIDTGSTGCNNTVLGLYCTNQQTAAAAPPNPASFTQGTVTTTSIALSWASGGGTTAAYKLAYQTGASAPANCNTGTLVAASTLGINPVAYTVTGLTSGTQYSFRLCALNSDQSLSSAGSTLTVTTNSTTTTANQTIFATGSSYRATFGGLYFADFVCQTEASNAGLAGIWKAVMSDSTANANARITLSATVWNNRPAGSGGPQQIATNATFWTNTWTASPVYSASGGTPATTASWTGSTNLGAVNLTRHCSNWTSNLSSAIAQYGNNNSTGANNGMAVGTTGCNNLLSFYCMNQQTASAAPANPTNLTAYQTTSNSIGLSWASGGGTTAAYQISYQAGGTAPASCTTGTIVSAATLGFNPTTYTIQGLSASTQYSFRLCAANSDVSSFSSGTTITVTTVASGNPTTYSFGSNQYIFSTNTAYYGNIGGIYVADYACQFEATQAGLPGVWKAVLSDTSNSALTRIALSGNVYNLRASSSGGAQIFSDSTNFWNNLMYNSAPYTATGNTPSTNINWTGSNSTGTSAANNCTDWTSVASTTNGQYGQNNTTNSVFGTGATNCNSSRLLYCINGQSAAAAPSNPSNFTNYSIGASVASLSWTSGGGTTAAYKIAYQTGGTAPANCNTGSVILPATIGVGATSYTVTSLANSTQYSFRLCALNSDLSAASSGVTLTLTTLASGATTTTTPGTMQMIFSTETTYTGNFGGIYFGDYICQQEATTAGLPGVWKSITSDETTSASSRLSISSSAIYNMRPASAGGAQVISNGTSFWAGPWPYNLNYAAAGGSPGQVRNWTGTNSFGVLNAGNTCTSWTSSSSAVNGTAGYSTSPANGVNLTNNACNNTNSLYCINQQTASATPPDPTGFANYMLGPTSAQFVWASGGGTTAAFVISYQAGASAPANCASGTVIPAATLGLNPTSATVTGLSSSAQYSFRLCAQNSDFSATSTGVTVTLTTLASGASPTYPSATQQIFNTATYYTGNFGGIYYADFICQQEATNNGLTGVWKAIISDDTTSASSRISLSSAIYNSRAPASGGIQRISNGTSFWAGPWNYTTNYTAAGTSASTVRNWTGVTNTGGSNIGLTCSSWTNQVNTNSGEVGYSTNPANGVFLGTNNCATANGFFCINQQTASAAPPDASSFSAYGVGSTGVGLQWVSGGGTTAAFQIAYQTGASAPANCNTGTVITAAQLGVNPSTYALSGLSSGTQYSFRLCAENSDLSSASSGLTLTVTTLSGGSPTTYTFGTTQVMFSTTTAYQGNFGGVYFGDFACQQEAETAGLGGVWRAIVADESTPATSRISLSSAIYNNRPISSGGIQMVNNSSNFYGGPWTYSTNYTASGSAPATVRNWTGITNVGGSYAGNTCSSWTSSTNLANGLTGYSTQPQNGLYYTFNGCQTANSLMCINQQSAASAPPNVASFSAYAIGSDSVGFLWTSGGGTTAAYQIAYQAGGTAPANCNTGTIIAASALGVNPTTYTVSGLTPTTQYSFRICAENSNLTAASSGTTLTVTTTTSGTTYSLGSSQFIFSTAGTYYPRFGGIYYADYICQNEANSAGMTGIWRAVLADDTTNATVHVSIPGNLYNLRPLSSGGSQYVTNSFWGAGQLYATFNYTATGATPGSVYGWDGAQNSGATYPSYTCSSWTTTGSTTNGLLGRNNVSTSWVQNAGTSCNTTRGLFCVNQQAAAATPPDPASFTTYEIGSTYAGLVWSSGGGTTAAYTMSYQTGGTAPANCSTGTVISPSTLGVNPSTYAVSGLSASTQYSFRLCALNSDLSASSTGLTLTFTTPASGLQWTPGTNTFMFVTAGLYSPNFSNLYFGDFICQNEANQSGLSGTWKAVLGDDSTAPNSHVTLSGRIYNFYPVASGGSQWVATGNDYWNGVLNNLIRYTASSGTPGATRNWTGSTSFGNLNAGNTCSNWTNNTNSFNAGYGNNTSLTNQTYNGTVACNNSYSMLCVNQQTAAAAPPNPATLSTGAITTSSIVLNWTSGGGTTAAYQIAYQIGATAPADCTTGTVITASTLGVKPVTYTVTGLSSATQYSFRLCAENSDLSIPSAGRTVTATTN